MSRIEFFMFFPFLFFVIGYASMSMMYRSKTVQVPRLVGKRTCLALTQLSNCSLSMRIMEEHESDSIPEGTVISQNPAGMMNVRPGSTIFCVATKQCSKSIKSYILKPYDQVVSLLKDLGIKFEVCFIESKYPRDYCFCQSVRPGSLSFDQKIILYISLGQKRSVIVPDLKGKPVKDVLEFLSRCAVESTVKHQGFQDAGHVCDEKCVVFAQRPLAGTLVCFNCDKEISIQLQVDRAE